MSSSRQQNVGRLHKLSAHQIDSKYHTYKSLNDEFEEWLERTAKSHGWRGQTEGVEKFRQQGDFLQSKSVKLPHKIQESLKECIKLRKQLHLHYQNLSSEEIGNSKTWAHHEEMNEGHDSFNHLLGNILDILGVKAIDHDKVRRDRIAKELRKALREMQKMTEDVIQAWEQYRLKNLTLPQATLVTHAAIEDSQSLEKRFFDYWLQSPEDNRFVKEFYTDYDPKLAVIGENNVNTDLDIDLTGLLNQDNYYPQSDTFETSMDILHWPTIYVLSNFQGMMEQWKTYPVPGHPICLEHVLYEGKQHRSTGPGTYKTMTKAEWDPKKIKLSKPHMRKRAKQMKLKSQYKDQIKSTGKFLNEILYLHTHQLDTDIQARSFGILREYQEENEGDRQGKKEVFLPTDLFSKALSDVIQNPGKISMSTSFAIQLLVKICHLFEGVPSDATESKALPFREEVRDEATKVYGEDNDDDDERETLKCIRNTTEPLFPRIHASCQDGHTLWTKKKDLPNLSNNFEFHIDDVSNSIVEIGSGGEQISKTIVPPSPRIHVINQYMIDDWRHDATWHAKTAEYYSNTQPLYAGSLDLVRRIAEYRAGVSYANENLSIFAVAHLEKAPEASSEIRSQISPECEAVIHQHHDWFPQDFQARSASDIIDLIKNKVWKSGHRVPIQVKEIAGAPPGTVVKGDVYDTSEDVMMKLNEPVEALWRIFVLDNPGTRFSTFLQELQTPNSASGYNSWQLGSSSGDSWWERRGQVLVDSWPALPCSNAKWDFIRPNAICTRIISRSGFSQRMFRFNAETWGNFSCRVLLHFLQMWKSRPGPVQERGSDNGQGPFVQEDVDQISKEIEDNYDDSTVVKDEKKRRQNRERKNKNLANRKRKAAESKSNTESLARSDKRRKL